MLDDRLDGWKAIGNFLGRDRTTALRWAKERHLPVHRIPGGRIGTVYALRSELSEWLAAGDQEAAPVLPDVTALAAPPQPQPQPQPPSSAAFGWRTPALMAALACAMLALLWWQTRHGNDVPIGIGVRAAPGADQNARQFSDALAADLARFANASPGLAVREESESTSPGVQYAVRTTIDRDARGLAVNARLVAASDGMVVWSRQFKQTTTGISALRERVAANLVGVLRCSFIGIDLERARLKSEQLAMLLAACQAIVDGDNSEAIARARVFTVARSDLSIGWALLGELVAYGSDSPVAPAEARRAVRRAQAITPDGLETYVAAATLVGQNEGAALPILERGLRSYPDAPSLLFQLSGKSFNLGYARAGAEYALRGIRSDPTWLYGRDLTIRRLTALGRFAEARQLQTENERFWPGHPAVVLQHNRLIADIEEIDGIGLEAKIAARKRDYKTEPSTAYMLARLYERVGDHDAALAWLDRAPVGSMARHQWSMLFWPGVGGLRAEPAFFHKMAELGLVRWWVQRRKWPDFCAEPRLKYNCAAEAAKLGYKTAPSASTVA